MNCKQFDTEMWYLPTEDKRNAEPKKKIDKKIVLSFVTFKLKLAIFSSKFSLLPKTIRSSDAQNMIDYEIHVKNYRTTQ